MVKQIEMTDQQKFKASFTKDRIKSASEWILQNDVGVIHYIPNNRNYVSDNKGGMTLVYRVHESTSRYTFIEVANAICSNKEQYNKAIGRTIATERLQAGKFISLPYDKKMNITPQKIIYNLSNCLGYDVYYNS